MTSASRTAPLANRRVSARRSGCRRVEGSEGWARARQAATGKTFKDAKRVSKDSWRRFAYPEKEKALSSYKARKRHQLGHAELALERAKTALADIKDIEAINDEHLCSGGDYIKQLNWTDC